MALTNDPKLAERLALSAHARNYPPRAAAGRPQGASDRRRAVNEERDGPWMYEQIELGLNYRMTDIQSALGTSQLARLDPFVARRRELAARYDQPAGEAAADVPVAASRYELGLASLRHSPAPQRDQAQPAPGVRSRCAPPGSASTCTTFRCIRSLTTGNSVSETGMFPEAESYYEDAITCRCFRA